MSYGDSSALVKLYAKEADSSVFEQFAADGDIPITSRLAFYEIQATLRRKEFEGLISKAAAEMVLGELVQDICNRNIVVVEFTPAVC